MKSKIKLFKINIMAVIAMLMMMMGVNLLQANTPEPCGFDYEPPQACQQIGPLTMYLELEDCSGCTDCSGCGLYATYYYLECPDRQETRVQLVSLMRAKPAYPKNLFDCGDCQSVTSRDVWLEAFVHVFKQVTDDYTQPDGREYILEERSCRKYIGPPFELLIQPTFVPQDTIEIPVSQLVNPLEIPGFTPPGDDIVRLPNYGMTVVCNTECCCFILEDYWDQNDNLTALHATEPCDNNPPDNCPEDCSGGCSQLMFSWYEDHGMFLMKQPEGLENYAFSNEISISPNPNEGTFDCMIKSEETGQIEIGIKDVTGKTIKNLRSTKEATIFEKKFKIDNLSKGTYYLYVLINGSHAGYQKLIID